MSTKIDRVTSKDISANPQGLLSDWSDQDPPARIWVKTWAEIIAEREKQLRFFKDALNYDASRQHAVDYINKHIADENVPVALRAPHSITGPLAVRLCRRGFSICEGIWVVVRPVDRCLAQRTTVSEVRVTVWQ
ncbi:Uncharacterised protein [Mycobacteroides abscessus subsp. abscessus]|nr:Uncharacterised protein [Mycobacteroides abscessus subsp. abscessus]